MTTYRSNAVIVLSALMLSACSWLDSRDTKAAAAASDAEAAFQQGRNAAALKAIHLALASRDDVSDYWLLLGRIDTANKNLAGAFDAYENVIELDRGNVEALRLLCQLGLGIGNPEKVDKYADQLLLLTPGDPVPLVMKGGAALQRGDGNGAMKFADQVLASNPQNHEAQILKGRILASKGETAAAANYVEGAIAGSDDGPRLTYLMQLYLKAGDRPHYLRTVRRLAAVEPEDAEVQLKFADVLYQINQPAAANAIVVAQTQRHPNDVGVAAMILNVWLQQGLDVLKPNQIEGQAAPASLEMMSTYAQLANEMEQPSVASTVLSHIGNEPVNAANADAKAAQAYALGLEGRLQQAIQQLDQILAVDAMHPGALIARARLKQRLRDPVGAIADARSVVADDPRNVTARLVLADSFLAKGDVDLALATLREGVTTVPEDTRLASKLADLLLARGKKGAALDVLRNSVRASPMNLRAWRLLASLDPTVKVPQWKAGNPVEQSK